MILPDEESPVFLPILLPHDAMLLYPGQTQNLVKKKNNPEKVLGPPVVGDRTPNPHPAMSQHHGHLVEQLEVLRHRELA